jgi:hypothetical protein
VSLYRTLVPKGTFTEEKGYKEPGVVFGYLGCAVHKTAEMFEYQYVILNTNTGKLQFYHLPHTRCILEVDLRFTKVLPLDQGKNLINLKHGYIV